MTESKASGLAVMPRQVSQSNGFLAQPGVPAASVNGFKPPSQLPMELKYSYTNSSGATTNLMFFDPIGAVESATGLTVVTPTPNVLSNAIINKYFAANPILIGGIRIEATSTAQFNQQLAYYTTDFNGQLYKNVASLETNITGGKYDETIQYYNFPFVVNSWVGIVLPVLNGQTVYVTFEPSQEYNRIR